MGLPARKWTEPADDPEQKGAVSSGRHQPSLSAPRSASNDSDLWHDVFVYQPLPWSRFLQSAVLHTRAFGLIWGLSISVLRQQKILATSTFDRS